MQTLEDRIINHLQAADGCTTDEIANSIGVEAGQVEAMLENLQNSGKVDYYRSGYPLKWGLANST